MQLSAPLWQDKLFASMELEAISDRQTVGGNNVGMVWLVNATLFSQKIVKGLDVSASIYFDFVKINLAVFRRLCQLCFGLTIQRNIF